MRRILVILMIIIFSVSSCSRKDKNFENDNASNRIISNELLSESNSFNNLLLEAYLDENYIACLEILKNGADGRIDIKSGYPILFDICQKYLDDSIKKSEIVDLFNFYLKNRKEAFKDSIYGMYPSQTVGSYISRFVSFDLLQILVEENIDLFSPEENTDNSYIYELAFKDKKIYRNEFINMLIKKENKKWKIYEFIINNEKKKRMELLLNAGANVTLLDKISKAGIFHSFDWYPFEDDYTEILDKMAQNGADLFLLDRNGKSCIVYTLNASLFDSNTEAYLEYLISRGVKITEEYIYILNSNFERGERYGVVNTEEEQKRLNKIKIILKNAIKN